jgi:hypothetical protein
MDSHPKVAKVHKTRPKQETSPFGSSYGRKVDEPDYLKFYAILRGFTSNFTGYHSFSAKIGRAHV